MKSVVAVVGSANIDLVVSCDRFPKAGETILGRDFGMYPGGKGANQASACARLGAEVHFLAKVGRDAFRDRLMESLRATGIDPSHVLVDEEAPTGVALITVDGRGQNEIIVVSGSNMRLSPEDVRANDEIFEDASVVGLQLEVPLETVMEAARTGKRAGAAIILNPAPARQLPDGLLRHVDFLTPNESEASLLSGVEVIDTESAERAARILLDRGVRCVIVTLGAGGALLVREDGSRQFPAYRVDSVDTTAAGDAFNGALAHGLGLGQSVEDAIDHANGVAAFAVTRMGAQTSMPSSKELESFLTDVERVVLDATH